MYNFLNTESNLKYFSFELGNEGNSHTSNLGTKIYKDYLEYYFVFTGNLNLSHLGFYGDNLKVILAF